MLATNSFWNHLFALSLAAGLTACDAVGVAHTSDPMRKLQNAQDMDALDRPLAAEMFIEDAIVSCKATNDSEGLARGYKAYARFLNSRAVEHYAAHYRQSGFLNKSVTFDTRLEKSVEFLLSARELFLRSGDRVEALNVEFNAASAYETLKQSKLACDAYKRCLDDYSELQKNGPMVPMHYPPEFKSFEDWTHSRMEANHCPDFTHS